MDESAKEGAGERETHEPDAAKAPANEAAATPQAAEAAADRQADGADADGKLPVVWSPKLDAGDIHTDAHTDAIVHPGEADDDPWSFSPAFEHDAMKDERAATGMPKQSSRTLQLGLIGGALAIAAAFGSFAGAHWATAGRAAVAKAPIVDGPTPQALKAEIAELTALKASVELTSRNIASQMGKLSDRLDRVEHAQAEPAAKLAHIADVVERLEKQRTAAAAPPAAPETTGSIASSPAPTQLAAAEAKPTEKVLHEWVVQSVQGGRALVESRYGGLFFVGPGSVLPGLGRVDAVKRQDGEWIVVTARGLITTTGD
jgi:hypothetical protein